MTPLNHSPAPWNWEQQHGDRVDIEAADGTTVAENVSVHNAALISCAPVIVMILEQAIEKLEFCVDTRDSTDCKELAADLLYLIRMSRGETPEIRAIAELRGFRGGADH